MEALEVDDISPALEVTEDFFNTFDNKYNARIGRLNFDSVDKFIKMSLAIGKFRKMLLKLH